MIRFSLKNKAFYDRDLNYSELPNDLIDITEKQHEELLNALNTDFVVFKNLTFSTPKPSNFHTWNGTVWVDNRTAEQIVQYERSLLPALTKRQFSLYLYDIKKYEQVMNAINANPRFKIEFDTVATIERLSPTVSALGTILKWDNLTIDKKWKEALKL